MEIHQNSTSNNKPFHVTCSRMDTTEDLANNINQKLPSGTNAVDLTHNGQYLSNGRTLASQEIQNNSRIQMTSKLRGG